MTVTTIQETTEGWALLQRCREMVAPRIREVLEGLAEPVGTVARYHFGFCDAAGRPADDGWGKGVRGALVLGSALAVGAGGTAGGGGTGSPVPEVRGCMVAMELVHNFSLLHDDVMDRDRLRRGRPTAWAVFGEAQALLAGDALFALAMDELVTGATWAGRAGGPGAGRSASPAGNGQAPGPGGSRAADRVSELCAALVELVAGQSKDVDFERRTDVALQECLTMAAGKTASLLAGACALGALSAGGTPAQVASLRAFGHHLGLAFQSVDDLLGIWGDPHTTGKAVGADLRYRKKSLPVVAALCGGTPAGRRLAGLYRGEGAMTDTDVATAAALVEEAGGRHWAEQEAARQRRFAEERLADAAADPAATHALLSLADLVTRRSR